MNRTHGLLVLLLAALLEAAGDALVRVGMHAPAPRRMILFGLGAVVLFAYGYSVNAPGWDFGRLLGIYVVFFFLAAQAINWFAFHQKPSAGVLIGGLFIVAGGVLMTAIQR